MNIYQDLPGAAITELSKVQEDVKTSKGDEILDLIRDIFETNFILNSKGEFDNEDDFYEQYYGLSAKQGNKNKFDRIPTRYIKYLCIKKYHESRNPSYIKNNLRDIIEYKKAGYKNTTEWCFARIGEIDKRMFNIDKRMFNKGSLDNIKISGVGMF